MQNKIIFVYWNNGIIKEMTSKNYHKKQIYLKPHLFWSNNSHEPDYVYKNGKWNYIGQTNDTDNICVCGVEKRNCIC